MPLSRIVRNASDIASVHPPLRIADDVLRKLRASDEVNLAAPPTQLSTQLVKSIAPSCKLLCVKRILSSLSASKVSVPLSALGSVSPQVMAKSGGGLVALWPNSHDRREEAVLRVTWRYSRSTTAART
jgi:hypothetical protein